MNSQVNGLNSHVMRMLTMLVLATGVLTLKGQGIENVIVETYYVSDASDASDTTGGGLPAGSRTYRIYLDLTAGCALRGLYGDINHALIIQSTAPFFNHLDRGKTYGHEINNGAIDEGTVALDSWLSFGAATNQRLGILKTDDPDGSEVGGANNDGGSAEIPEGLLVNTVDVGVPLTVSDGLVPLNGAPALPPTFTVIGDDLDPAFKDSTLVASFVSNSTHVGCATPGMVGPTADNRILLAQITTAGELSFELNVELECGGALIRFVANGDTLLPDEAVNGLLVYPPECGCTDPNFLEYDPNAGCDDGSCATTIVFGCLDQEACNYDPNANFNVAQLCCYGPTDCNGLDVTVVCPDVRVGNDLTNGMEIGVGPIPTSDLLQLHITAAHSLHLRSTLLDALGRKVMEVDHGMISGSVTRSIVLGDLAPGSYHMVIDADGTLTTRTIIKD